MTSRTRRRAACFTFFLSLFLLTSDFVLRTSVAAQATLRSNGVVPDPPSVPISPRRSAAFGAIIVAGHADSNLALAVGLLAVVLATVNMVGGFVVTDRMLEMFVRKTSCRGCRA